MDDMDKVTTLLHKISIDSDIESDYKEAFGEIFLFVKRYRKDTITEHEKLPKRLQGHSLREDCSSSYWNRVAGTLGHMVSARSFKMVRVCESWTTV